MNEIHYKLGKTAPRHDSRTLKFESYITGALPPTPAAIDWTGKVPDFLMLGNNSVGNCTCASLAHCEMLWTSQSTVELVPTTQQVLDLYSAITGYNPQDPNSDQGANVLDVLNYWRNTGFLNHKIQAYVQINPRNTAHVKAAVDLFGAVYTGIQVPSRAQDQFSNGQPWDDINPDEIEGGHAIPLVAYDPNYITCVTWGAKQKISYPWLAKYMDECYAVLSTDWIAANGSAPSGFNLGQLYTDLRLVQ